MLKGLRILMVSILTLSLVACESVPETTARPHKGDKLIGRVGPSPAQQARNEEAVGQLIGTVVVAALVGAAVASNNRRSYGGYNPRYRYRGVSYGPRGNRSFAGPRHTNGPRFGGTRGGFSGRSCVMYDTPNPYPGMCN